MLKTYLTISNTLKKLLKNKKGVSHLLEVVGVLALVAVVLALIFPNAKTEISNLWTDLIGKIESLPMD